MKEITVRNSLFLLVLLLVSGGNSALGADPAADSGGIEIGPHVFGAMRARGIGPAVMSGRISSLDVVDADPRLMYIGSAGGGVWKTRNGGINFEPVFDDHNQCIGAVTIDQATRVRRDLMRVICEIQ